MMKRLVAEKIPLIKVEGFAQGIFNLHFKLISSTEFLCKRDLQSLISRLINYEFGEYILVTLDILDRNGKTLTIWLGCVCEYAQGCPIVSTKVNMSFECMLDNTIALSVDSQINVPLVDYDG